MNVAETVRTAIEELLTEFVENPALHLREAGFQAALWAKIQNGIRPADALLPVHKVLTEDGRKLPHQYGQLQTGRVHREVELGRLVELGRSEIKMWQSTADRQDIVVLRRDSTPTLFCTKQGGATDFKQRLLVGDVAVAVEIKSIPSNWANKPNAPKECREDLEKLRAIKKENPEAEVMFVLFDKSVSLPAATSAAKPAVDWAAQTATALVNGRPARAYVEVWDLDENVAPPTPRLRFWPL